MIILVFCLLQTWTIYIHSFIHQFCLRLVATSCGFAFNSSYHNIIDYHDNLARISQNIVIIFFGYRTGLHYTRHVHAQI